jgi:hypothetical protein
VGGVITHILESCVEVRDVVYDVDADHEVRRLLVLTLQELVQLGRIARNGAVIEANGQNAVGRIPDVTWL